MRDPVGPTRPGRVGSRDRRRGVVAVKSVAATALISLLSIVAATASVTAEASPSSSSTVAGWPVTNYVAYTGGRAGPANSKLPPVYIGWVNQQGGVADIAPEATVGADFAVQYINSHLGGIDGHPLRLVKCFIPDTVSAAAQCGQALANNGKVQQIVVGAPITVGNQAFESALLPTHKLLNMFAGQPSDSSYKDAVWLYGSTTSLEALRGQVGGTASY